MLALSSTADTNMLTVVVESTAAVIFLSTPHQGSPELSAIGEWARSFLGSLRFQTTATILNTLGLKNDDLERAHESFIRLWRRYDSRVKTFQEGFGITGVNLGVLGDKVVPDTSSLIGDPREHAETLQASHIQMCRFSSARDPNYIKVAGELMSVYKSVYKSVENDGIQKSTNLASQAIPLDTTNRIPADLHHQQDMIFQKLRFQNMGSRQQAIRGPATGTGQWLFENQTYREWLTSNNQNSRLFLLKGKLGTGKSTLMKEAFQHARRNHPDYIVISFFVNGKGGTLEHSQSGVFRALLYQLLPHYLQTSSSPPPYWSRLPQEYDWLVEGIPEVEWTEAELELRLEGLLLGLSHKNVLIFIDALDELSKAKARSQVRFWKKRVDWPELTNLRVCLSCRHIPHIWINNSLELVLEDQNRSDISAFVDFELGMQIPAEESLWKAELAERISVLSNGVFLWVVLVVVTILAKHDEGSSLVSILAHVNQIPLELGELYTQIIQALPTTEKAVTNKMFQWALGAARPLRLDEWHHVLGFIREPAPSSLREWRASKEFTGGDQQLERLIRTMSGGLLELSRTSIDRKYGRNSASSSICVGAGSLDDEQGEARVVQVIHESVREYFLKGSGFTLLSTVPSEDSLADCHSTIVKTCADYMRISELDNLVLARQATTRRSSIQSSQISFSGLSQHAEEESSFTEEKLKLTRENLEALSVSHSRNIIAGWMLGGSSPSLTAAASASTNSLGSYFLLDKVPEVLQDYPALLLYTVSEFRTHVHIATRPGSRLKEEIAELCQEASFWARFVALNEDISWDTNPSAYLSKEDTPLPNPDRQKKPHRKRPARNERQRRAYERAHEFDMVFSQIQTRSRSIASFGSASSYGRRTSVANRSDNGY
jgi:hypothetical protein